MAEASVGFTITAEDRASAVIEEVGGKLEGIGGALDALGWERSLAVDASGALAAVASVGAALDAIPDVTTKSVVIQYYTQASPVMEFSSGIAYIKERMEALPSEGAYTVKYAGVPEAGGAGGGATVASSPSGGGTTNFSASITVNAGNAGGTGSGGAAIARDIDAALADLWRYNRSALRKAVQA